MIEKKYATANDGGTKTTFESSLLNLVCEQCCEQKLRDFKARFLRSLSEYV